VNSVVIFNVLEPAIFLQKEHISLIVECVAHELASVVSAGHDLDVFEFVRLTPGGLAKGAVLVAE
jgi:hypothetical protein